MIYYYKEKLEPTSLSSGLLNKYPICDIVEKLNQKEHFLSSSCLKLIENV